MPTSTRQWRATSAVAAPMCASAKGSSARLRQEPEGDTMTTTARAPSRRSLLKAGLAGGFVFAFHLPLAQAAAAPNDSEGVPPEPGPFAPNAFIRIDAAGKTTFVMPQVEMGQGVYTALSMILAEELD